MAHMYKNKNNKAIQYLTDLINDIVQDKIQVTDATYTIHECGVVDLPTGSVELDFIILPTDGPQHKRR